MNFTSEKIAVVLLSGGMDSALCAAIAKKEGWKIAALHLNYKQRTEKRELHSFNQLADYYNAKYKLIVDINYLSQIGGSSLTDSNIEVSVGNFDSNDIPTSYVPFRNANFLAIATSWAEVIGANAVYIGANQLDYSGYPDCRSEFYDSFQKVIETGTKPETNIKIIAPIINFTKKDIVVKGSELGLPFNLTWSCYKNNDKACGVCDSCVLRLKGFKEAGIEDPVEYV
jgi:7-cyano-7-deazaguanine synthase